MPIDVRARNADGSEVIYRVNTDDPEEARRRARREHEIRRNMSEARERAQPQRPQSPPPPPPAPARTAYERNQGAGYVSRDQAASSPTLARQREQNLTRNYSDFGGGVQSLSQGATFGFGDEIDGGLNAFGAGVAEATQFGPDYFDRIGSAARTAYEDTTDTSRLFMERNRERAPIVSTVNEIGGSIVTSGGAGALRNRAVAAARGVPVPRIPGARPPATAPTRTLGGRATEAAQAGAVGGYAYGFGANDGDLGERMESGGQGAALGAVVGGATPYAVRAAEPAWRAALRGGGAIRRTAERVIPTPAPNSVGMSGGNLAARPPGDGALRRPPPAPPPPEVSGEQLNFINRMREREMLSVDDLEQNFAEARANPQGQRVVDLFGDTGTRTFRPIVQGPGQTSRLAQDAAESRFAQAPEQLENSLRRGLQVGETLDEAMARLRDDYSALDPRYRELFSTELTAQQQAQQRALFDQRIAPLLSPDNPNRTVREIMRDARERAEELFDLDLQRGAVQGRIDDNLGRYLHYLKQGIAARARFDASPLRGIDGQVVNGIRALYRQFSDLIDPTGNPADAIVPGYRAVTDEAGDYFTANEALQEGAAFVRGSRSSPEAVRRRFAEMTPFERRHARIGLADAILRGTEGATGGRNVNVARALTDRRLQRIIAAAFDPTPEGAAEAARFLSLVGSDESTRAAPGIYRLMDNASQWRGGASTFANAMHSNDEAVQAGADMVGSTVQGNPAAAVGRGARWLQNQATLGMVERANNQRGEVALRRVDLQDSRAFTDEVIRLLREREARAAAGQTLAPSAAGVAGSQPGRE